MAYSLGCSDYRSHQHYTCAPPLSARAYGKHSPTHKGGKPLKKTKITKKMKGVHKQVMIFRVFPKKQRSGQLWAASPDRPPIVVAQNLWFFWFFWENSRKSITFF